MPSSRAPSFLRRYRWPIAILALVVGVAVVAPFVYINVIKDDPAERLTLDDVTTTTSGTGGSSGAAGIDGTWTATDESVVQYRVKEVLFGQDSEATGTANGVAGTVVISGTRVTSTEVEVDMTTFESGESLRDGQFQGRIMNTAEFPTASFVLTQPIDLATLPADGEEITVEVTGELTLHGVTKEATFALAAKRTGATFAANATIPVAFSDYDIADPSGGPAQVGDDGELELLLVFVR